MVAQPFKIPDGVLHFTHPAAILLGKRLRGKVHQIGIQPVLVKVQGVLLPHDHLSVLFVIGAHQRDRPFQRVPGGRRHPEGIVVAFLQRHRGRAQQQKVGGVLHGILGGGFVLGLHQPLAQLHQILGKGH